MNFNELVSEVLSIVKRPDKQDRIESAVRAATLKAHRQDFFYKDVKESGVQFTNPDCVQNFAPKEIFGTRFRKLKYIRFWNFDATDLTANGRGGKFLDYIDTNNSIDAYGYLKSDVYYMAGELIQIRTSNPLSHCLVGAYINPIVTSANFESWIADQQPYAIVYEAARQLFKEIGKNSDSNDMRELLAEEYAALVLDSVNQPGE